MGKTRLKGRDTPVKILILSCNTGGGHNSAALAVQEALHERGAWAEIVDPLSFAGDAAKEAASNLYNSIIRNVPKAFGVIYRVGELADSALPKSPVYMANALYADKLLAYIREQAIDAVVSTHLYGMEAMTAIRKKLGERVPNYGVLTDYTCIPFFSDTQLDGYFIPHRDLRGELAAKGIDEKLMYDTGIPVSARFSQRLGQSEARERLDLPRRGAVYLVMTGEVGCGRADELCDELIARETGDFTACVMVGRNEKMRDMLIERYGRDGHIRPVEYTREVNVYMNAADALITKPGGLSSTEAAAARVPLVHLITIPGCEEKNAAFFEARGLSHKTESMREAARLAVELAHDSQAGAAMRARQAEEINPHAARDIAEIVYEQLGMKEA